MRRNQIIFGVVLLLVLAAFGGVYQFYFKEKLDQYKRDEGFRRDLEASADELQKFFSNTSPETIISLWRAEVQPWVDTLQQRAGYFDDGGWFRHETPPESGRILRVWYGEELNKMLTELYQDIAEKAPNIYPFPPELLKTIKVRTESELAQEKEVTPALVNEELARMAFASNVINLLLDEKIVGLNNLVVWPTRQDKNHKGQLLLNSVGVDANMYMRHLTHMLEVLRRQRRYFTVDAIHINNPYISSQAEPLVNVRMIITQGQFSGQLEQDTGAGSAQSLFEMNSSRTPKPTREAEPELSGFGKFWKWFKRTILYMN